VRLLVEHGPELNISKENGWTLLSAAASYGHLDKVKLLLDSGADIERTEKSGQSSLCTAAYQGNARVVDLLLQRGANTSLADKRGNTTIHLTTQGGRTRVVKLLLEIHGICSNTKNRYGLNAFFVAAIRGHVDTLKVLFQHNPLSDAMDRYQTIISRCVLLFVMDTRTQLNISLH
jgi:ankyrin repeat protein